MPSKCRILLEIHEVIIIIIFIGSESPQKSPLPSPGSPKINTSSTVVGSDSVTLHWNNAEDHDKTDAHVVAHSPAVGTEAWTYLVAQVNSQFGLKKNGLIGVTLIFFEGR